MRSLYLPVLLAFTGVGTYSSTVLAQQNNLLNTYSYDLMQLNIASIGSCPVEANINYRSQWINAKDNPSVLHADVGFSVGKNTGLGVKILQQNLGLLSFTAVTGAYVYRLRFTNGNSLRLGAGLAWKQNSFRADKAIVIDQGDASLTSNTLNRVNNLDLEVGAVFSNERLQLGVGSMNIYNTNQAKNQFAYLVKPQINSFASYKLYEKNGISLQPWLVHRYNFTGNHQLDALLQSKLAKQFILGVGYRTGYGIIGMAGLEKNKFRFIYSFDYYLANQQTNYGSSHQVMIGYSLCGKPAKVVKPVEVVDMPEKVMPPVEVEEVPEVVEPEIAVVPEVKQPEKTINPETVIEELNTISEKMVFAIKQTVLPAEKQIFLDQLASILMKNPSVNVSIEGYASTGGSAELNNALSEKRAAYVKAELVKRGVDSNQIKATVSKGTSIVTPNQNANRTIRFKQA